MRVCVLSSTGFPLMPCHPARARQLLAAGRATVLRRTPFTVQLLDRNGGAVQPIELKIDPGSKTTGMALVVEGARRGRYVVAALELHHRGSAIRKALLQRRQLRRGRRSRHCRYRAPRFLNRTRPEGWLAPSLQHRVDSTMGWVTRLRRVLPISALVVERVRFDLQALENPEIAGVEYQQGTLAGYEVREYLLEKWNRTCAYCNAKNLPLQIEHIVPRAAGGSNRVSNLTLACERCNTAKGMQRVEDFLKPKPERLRRILAQARAPLRDAAAVNSTRRALWQALRDTGLPVTASSGGRTKYNRCLQRYPKAHWIDAACTGPSGGQVDLRSVHEVLSLTAKGRGDRQMCRPDTYGFPRTAAKAAKRVFGFQSGDLVRLVQPRGKHRGTWIGPVAVRADGRFDIATHAGKITAPHTRFQRLARFDGYTYARRAA
ncbi:RNA-guided endonuclease IscB [Aquimonas sp.]|uniref:RNA-guided endonuclease IscB n=1 Tax=Aquimonas sp. TaxID=1872588 RepID=UPI0037BFC9C9